VFPRRVSIAGALAIVAGTAVLLGLCVVPVERHMEWVRLSRQIDTSIRYLKPSQPNPATAATWDCAHGWVFTAYCNVCSSPGKPGTAEMYRLRDDLDARLKGPHDLKTLRWIWDRLGETSPYGKQYTERYGPRFRDCFPPGSI